MFILAADIVFVIVLPQLVCAVFLKWTNIYGSVTGLVLGTLLRLGAGEPSISLEPFITYPIYNQEYGQLFPFRTFAFVSSLVCVVVVSLCTKRLPHGRTDGASNDISTPLESELQPPNVTVLNGHAVGIQEKNLTCGVANPRYRVLELDSPSHENRNMDTTLGEQESDLSPGSISSRTRLVNSGSNSDTKYSSRTRLVNSGSNSDTKYSANSSHHDLKAYTNSSSIPFTN